MRPVTNGSKTFIIIITVLAVIVATREAAVTKIWLIVMISG